MNIAFVKKHSKRNPCTVIVSRLINFEYGQILSYHSEHGEISTVNGEHFIADILTMSSTTSSTRGVLKNCLEVYIFHHL